MPIYQVRKEIIPWTDPRLRRFIRHDSRSLDFQHPRALNPIRAVDWSTNRKLPILEQLVGCCTADATFGILGTEPFYSAVGLLVLSRYGSFDQAGANKFYSDEETFDGDGTYPPDDCGSCGLTAAQVARSAGLITGWTQTYDLPSTLSALMEQPFITGTTWYESMMNPDGNGLLTVDPSSGVAGGHEWILYGFDPATNLLKIGNSWGDWGLGGYAYMRATDYAALLAAAGDTTIFNLPGQVSA